MYGMRMLEKNKYLELKKMDFMILQNIEVERYCSEYYLCDRYWEIHTKSKAKRKKFM